MKKYLSLLSILISISFFGQCPETNVVLIDQAEVDAFIENYPDCKIIKGDLTIKGNNIINLNGLNNIQSVSGYVNINSNNILTNLDGLNNLNSIEGNLSISNNKALINLTGLNNLKTIGGFLDIFRNPTLSNFSGLNNLLKVQGNLNIKNNNILSSFSGINNLKTIGGHLNIYSNPLLENLEGLDNLQSIEKNLVIGFNNSLTNLLGLNNLQSIGEYLYIYSNTKLINLFGLDSLNTIGNELSISNNANLNNIDGLSNIDPASIKSQDSFTKDIEISNNPLLSKCAIKSICNAIGLNKTMSIEDNGSSCNSISEIQESCIALSNNNIESTNNIKVYPNPTKDIINVQTNDSIKKIEIYSITGKLLDVFGSTNQVSTAKYSSGVYILLVYTDNGAYEQKIIKK